RRTFKPNLCWVCLPPDARPTSWPRLRKPVVPLRMALCGHPDSGTTWEKHCDAHVQSVGFVPFGSVWPSCYFHAGWRLFLVIYVDDFKMAGPTERLADGWSALRKGLVIEDAKPLGVFHELGSVVLPSGKVATSMTYNMQNFLESCVALYRDLAGP